MSIIRRCCRFSLSWCCCCCCCLFHMFVRSTWACFILRSAYGQVVSLFGGLFFLLSSFALFVFVSPLSPLLLFLWCVPVFRMFFIGFYILCPLLNLIAASSLALLHLTLSLSSSLFAIVRVRFVLFLLLTLTAIFIVVVGSHACLYMCVCYCLPLLDNLFTLDLFTVCVGFIFVF